MRHSYPTVRTAEQEAYRRTLAELRHQLDGITNVLNDALVECPHAPIAMGTEWFCDVCDVHLGTICNRSPDAFCHRELLPGARVKLYSGAVVRYQPDVDAPYPGFWSDSADFSEGGKSLYCIYCGKVPRRPKPERPPILLQLAKDKNDAR